jgi:hypothetical protein
MKMLPKFLGGEQECHYKEGIWELANPGPWNDP